MTWKIFIILQRGISDTVKIYLKHTFINELISLFSRNILNKTGVNISANKLFCDFMLTFVYQKIKERQIFKNLRDQKCQVNINFENT